MARRVVHNKAEELLMEWLLAGLNIDKHTARRLFIFILRTAYARLWP
ncbi:hypothetical protein C7I87_27940 [Mesorhizobium sp. SARCC-RB16n]|nr:UPF0262 family protein [Mesorhizobium sp. SARCC-RB16n]KAA3447257.1 hypothetical protein C7I87_27940 [Mesorhizobium sp. SARCC-RB16n]